MISFRLRGLPLYEVGHSLTPHTFRQDTPIHAIRHVTRVNSSQQVIKERTPLWHVILTLVNRVYPHRQVFASCPSSSQFKHDCLFPLLGLTCLVSFHDNGLEASALMTSLDALSMCQTGTN